MITQVATPGIVMRMSEVSRRALSRGNSQGVSGTLDGFLPGPRCLPHPAPAPDEFHTPDGRNSIRFGVSIRYTFPDLRRNFGTGMRFSRAGVSTRRDGSFRYTFSKLRRFFATRGNLLPPTGVAPLRALTWAVVFPNPHPLGEGVPTCRDG